MSLTSIGSQKTPGRPVEITFAADTGLPSDNQELLLIGHAASGATGTNTVVVVSNVSDVDEATTEAETKFGAGSELAKMVIAAVAANEGGSTFPKIKCCPLTHDETTIPAAAQTAIKAVKAEFLVTCYDMQNDSAETTILKSMALAMSGAQRVHNNQFGTFGLGANNDVTDPSNLTALDTQYLIACWLRDTGTPDYSLGEQAAAMAAKIAANTIPFNPLDDVTIANLDAPATESDWITVGSGLESETALEKGWTPVYVKPNGEVAFVRTVTTRLSTDGTGTPVLTSYYDVQDFQVLYYWRKTLYTRFSQSDLKQTKASTDAARLIKGEAIRLAVAFEDQNMFQAVAKLAKSFEIERSATDRHRFDIKTPVNVIPGLHVIATNIEATTEYDVVTV